MRSQARIENAGKSLKNWNYLPELPLKVSPLFTLPISLIRIFHWIWGSWFPLSERLILIGVTLISWFYFQPPPEECRQFAIEWIAEMYLRNLGLMILVAGGLHLYFYTFRKQGIQGHYDTRPLSKHNRTFTLGNQVYDNIFWTLGSGVTVWTGYESLMIWSIANDYAPYLSWVNNPIWFVILFILIPLWESFYFYLIHRMIHFPFLYKTVHYLHHRNTNVGPWSGLSMHPVEHVIYLGSVLIHFLIASHPLHILYHLQYFCLTAATTHSGFSGLFIKGSNRLSLGTFHHQMHHRYFECNYGGLELPLDKWFGSFHDGTLESHERFLEKRKLLKQNS